MGIRGYEGYEGYESSPRKTRHIFSWGYGDTRDTRALPEKPDTFLSGNIRIQARRRISTFDLYHIGMMSVMNNKQNDH